MHKPKLQGKSQVIPRQLLWDAWLKVKENGGSAGAAGTRQSRDLGCGLGVRWCGVAAWSVHGRRAGSGAVRFITRLKGGRVGPA
jgi:hypothetical protein